MLKKLSGLYKRVVDFTQTEKRKVQMATHLEEYLSFYQSLEEPGYAVLVTGEWGAGKTYQVLKCIPEEKRYYVSLFGVKTVEQLHAEVIAVASPKLSKANASLNQASEKVAAGGGFFALAGLTPSVFNAIFKRDIKPDRTLIFDDIERSGLVIKDLLGVINSYVEHHKFRVVAIAHDEEVAKEFFVMKEKIFGQTVRVEALIDEAFISFLEKNIDRRSKEFVSRYRKDIIETFSSSEVQSLRVLRHVIEDVGRLSHCLTDKHLSNSNAMSELVKFFTAMDVETRMSRLGPDSLNSRKNILLRYRVKIGLSTGEKSEKPDLMKVNERYSSIDLTSSLLSDDILFSIFFEGRYPEKMIQECLDSSSYFIKPSEAPPWKVVINFDEIDDAAVEAAVEKINQQFIDRSVTNSGEMLHIFSLKMMMVEKGIEVGTLEELTASCKTYIDDLLKSGDLPPRGTDWQWNEGFSRSYDGMGYWVSESVADHFKAVKGHLMMAREKALENEIPKIWNDLKSLMQTDAKQFLEKVSPTANGENQYALIPLFHHVQAEEFVEVWLDSPKQSWRYISLALSNRYSHSRIEQDLKVEREWVREVHNELERRVAAETGFRSLRISRVIPDVIRELSEDQ
ncbi:P-loop NTPase fold protein [Pistricoccus aurantiacus]|uniref:P-loop NTPase fold protein n=1 Tax=Pistricoccus aurantiacus TaxID=1883414 RepID=UPI003635BBD6